MSDLFGVGGIGLFDLGAGPTAPIAPRDGTTPGTRDWDAILDVALRLEATGRFDAVEIGGFPTDFVLPADRYAVAVVTPVDWEEIDDADSEENIHHARFAIILDVREELPRDRVDILDRLQSTCQDAIDGKSLGGFTHPAFTKLRRGRYEAPKHPEQRLTIAGEFQYLVIGHGRHDDSEGE